MPEETGTSGAPARGLPGPLRTALTASAFSGLGDGLVAAAFPLLIASTTDRPLLITGVLAAQRLPWALFSLHGGALVDRLPMRRLLPAVDLVRFVVVAALTAAVAAEVSGLIPLIYVAALVVGTGDTIFASGLQSAIPSMVDDDRLDRANGAFFISQAVTEHLAGPALGGLLFGVAMALPFGVDALTFLVSATLLARVLPSRPASTSQATVTADVREGLRWFLRQQDLRLMTWLIGSFAMLQGAILAVLVILVEDAFGGGGPTYGIVLAGAAVGNLLGAAVTERVGRRLTVPTTLLLFGAATGLAYVVLGLSPNPVVATACMAVEGIAVGVANIAAVGYRQRRIPREMLGRGTAIIRLVAYGSIPLGALLAGLWAEVVDIRAVVVAIGVLQVAAAVLLAGRLSAAMPSELAAPQTGGSAEG